VKVSPISSPVSTGGSTESNATGVAMDGRDKYNGEKDMRSSNTKIVVLYMLYHLCKLFFDIYALFLLSQKLTFS